MTDDTTIYDDLIAPMEAIMMRSIWRVVRNADLAEDALQDALSVIWKKRFQIQLHPNPPALILKICLNTAYDSLRKLKRMQRQIDLSSLDNAPTPPEYGADRHLEEREIFEVKFLEKYCLEADLLEKQLAGHDLNTIFPLKKAAGRIPIGTVGECRYQQLRLGVESFAQKSEPYLRGTILDPLEFDLDISGFRLTGKIDNLYPDRRLQYRYARIKPKDHLRIWVYHLILNKSGVFECPRTSLLMGLDFRAGESVWTGWEYPPLTNSVEILKVLLERYWQGLTKPLHFFSESSFIYAQSLIEKNRTESDALFRARENWTGNDYKEGENSDVYYQICFGNIDPLNEEFQQLAVELFQPIMDNQKKIS